MAHIRFYFFLSLICLFFSYIYPFHVAPWLTFYNDWFFALFVLFALLSNSQSDGLRIANPCPWALLLVGVIFHFLVFVQQPLLVDQWVQTLIFLAVGYLAYTLGLSARQSHLLEPILWSLCIAGAVSVVVALYQWLGQASGEGWQFGFLLPWSGGTRVGSNLGQANNFGMLMVICIWITFALRENGRLGQGYLIFLLATFFWVLGIYVSGSRAALLNLMVAIPVVWAFAYKKRWKHPWLVCLPLLVYGLLLVLNQVYAVLMEQGGAEVRSMVEDSARLTLWRFGLDALSQNLWWGAGQGALPRLYMELSPLYGSMGGTIPGHVHNTVLDLLIAHGLLLGGLIVAFFTYRIVKAVQACHSLMDVWLFLVIVGLSVHAMVEYPLNYGFFFWLFCLMLGVVTSSAPATPAYGRVHSRHRLFLVCSSIAGLLLSGWLWVQYVRVESLYTQARSTGVALDEVVELRRGSNLQVFPGLMASLYWSVHRISDQIDLQQLSDLETTASYKPFPDLMWKAAVGNAFHGRGDRSVWWLERLCALFPTESVAVQEAWNQLAENRQDWPEVDWRICER